MTFDEYQEKAHTFASYDQKALERFGPDIADAATFLYPSSKLAGEAGEVAEKMAKLVRDQGVVSFSGVSPESKLQIRAELSDCLWYIAEIAHRLDISLQDVAEYNIQKLSGRVNRGTINGDGDNR